MSDVPWRLRLLGAFELQRDGEAVDQFSARFDEQLLAYVTINAPTAVSREAMAADLWPEFDAVTARKNLSFNLFQLKRRLAERQLLEPIDDVRHSLRLSARIEVDAIVFTQAIASATTTTSVTERVMRLEQAVSIYGAGLLPDMSLPWLTSSQERFTLLYRNAVHALATITEQDASIRSLMENLPPTAWQATTRVLHDSSAPGRQATNQSLATARPTVDVSDFVRKAGEGLRSPERGRWVEQIGLQYPQIETAYRQALESGHLDEALQLILPIWQYWQIRGIAGQGRPFFEAILSTGYIPPAQDQAKLFHAAGTLAAFGDSPGSALPHLTQAIDLWRQLDSAEGLLRSLTNLGIAQVHRGDLDAAHDTYAQCVDLGEVLGNVPLLSTILLNAAVCEIQRGDSTAARVYLEKRLALLGGEDAQGPEVARTLANLATVDLLVDDYAGATEHATAALARFTVLQEARGTGLCQRLLGRIAYRRHELTEAIRLMREGVETARRADSTWELGISLGYLAIALEAAGETGEAAAAMLDATRLLRIGGDAGAIKRFETEMEEIRRQGG